MHIKQMAGYPRELQLQGAPEWGDGSAALGCPGLGKDGHLSCTGLSSPQHTVCKPAPLLTQLPGSLVKAVMDAVDFLTLLSLSSGFPEPSFSHTDLSLQTLQVSSRLQAKVTDRQTLQAKTPQLFNGNPNCSGQTEKNTSLGWKCTGKQN